MTAAKLRLYRRTTHGVNGDYKSYMDDQWEKIPVKYRCLIHLLDPHEWYTLNEFLSEVLRYAEDNQDADDLEVAGTLEKAETALEQLALEDIIEAIDLDDLYRNHVEYVNENFILPGWYFYDEVGWSNGPYETRALAEESLTRYCQQLCKTGPA